MLVEFGLLVRPAGRSRTGEDEGNLDNSSAVEHAIVMLGDRKMRDN